MNSFRTFRWHSFKPTCLPALFIVFNTFVFGLLIDHLHCFVPAMDMPSELTALNITPRGALLRWNPPLSMVDNYVLTLTHNQGNRVRTGCGWGNRNKRSSYLYSKHTKRIQITVSKSRQCVKYVFLKGASWTSKFLSIYWFLVFVEIVRKSMVTPARCNRFPVQMLTVIFELVHSGLHCFFFWNIWLCWWEC